MTVHDVPDILMRIEATKRAEIASSRLVENADLWRRQANAAPPPRDFIGALKAKADAGQPALIAEIKKASPSKGLIRDDFVPADLARAYADGGAACLSVLTDGPAFQGALAHLEAARAAVTLPVLRKDFMYVAEQVDEARVNGADAILVILTGVDDDTARRLVDRAGELSMAALLEVHDEPDLERALALPSPLLGINNRDLRTFHTNLAVFERLAGQVPDDRILIAESGIATHADVTRLMNAGAKAFLVGESLMRQPDVTAATRTILGRPLTHLNAAGEARMVDVSAKPETDRAALAEGFVTMAPETLAAIEAGRTKKGDVLATARIAGIMAAKRTSDLIPLCHPLPLSAVIVDLNAKPSGYQVTARATTTGRTGVEMEALTAVSVACLTLYDMAKAMDRGMSIGPIRLIEKSGGRSGSWRNDEATAS